MSDGGKGSAPRPVEVPRDEFNRRWEETFGKKEVKACSHVYSRSMHQEYPRKCIHCGAREESK